MPGWSRREGKLVLTSLTKLRLAFMLRLLPTSVRLQLLRDVPVVSLAASAVGVLLALAALVVSFVRPQIALEKLYAATKSAEWVGLGAIFAGLATLYVLDAVESSSPECRKFREQLRRRRYSWPAQIIGIAGVALGILFASGVLPSPRIVQPSDGKWITTGFGGSSEVLPLAAKLYLWRDISMFSFFLLVSACNVAAVSRSLLGSIRRSGSHEKRSLMPS